MEKRGNNTNKANVTRRLLPLVTLVSAVMITLLGPSCSTTKRLGPDQTLYTGVKKFNINLPKGERLPSDVESALGEVINVTPNNAMPFMSPYVRTPLPVGLWVYNNWNDSAGGIRGWLYKMLAKQPVLISNVRPEARVRMLKDVLDRNGYFGSTASYQLVYDKHNDKKARITYDVNVSTPYRIDSVIFINTGKHHDEDDGHNHSEESLVMMRRAYRHECECRVSEMIDSIAEAGTYLRRGSVFNVDSLNTLRVNIANQLRNKGYYFFRPEYIEYLADSLITPKHITIKLQLASNMPEAAGYAYRTGKVQTTLQRWQSKPSGLAPDTLHTERGELIVERPAKLRESLIPSCITFRKGRLFSVRGMDRTQDRLARLGIFSSIQIQPVPAPVDSADISNHIMDVNINCVWDRPIETVMEANVTEKSSSYLGPGIVFGLTQHNVFGGAEKLNVQLNANYEWQIGNRNTNNSNFNSYEFGLTGSLAFPRMLAPDFIKRRKSTVNWTTISLKADLLNRPHYFKMAEFNTGITYDWSESRYISHAFTPFKLSYTKLISTTAAFDSVMAQNPAVALSFQSQFVPQASYTFSYDKSFGRHKMDNVNITATALEAGNLFDLIWRGFGVKGRKTLFGTPFSQFIKGQVQAVYSRQLLRGQNQWVVSRLLVGAEHAYGNSREVPYSEQFYIGGANSIRAFAARSIGPGSYTPPSSLRNGYFDQTGTFKLEANCEYRFPIISMLHGAVFLDAGNVWLLKKDALRPGGEITADRFMRDIALGTGVGLRIDLGMMVVRGDLGYGLHNPAASLSSRYFNVKFKDAFLFHLGIGYPF